MSGIAALLNIPAAAEDLSDWNFVHAAAHTDINRVIFQMDKDALPSYVLDPMDPYRQDFSNWLYLHQQMHNDQNAILGISGFDLLEVDWKDPSQRAGWIQLHQNEHFQASNMLGIG